MLIEPIVTVNHRPAFASSENTTDEAVTSMICRCLAIILSSLPYIVDSIVNHHSLIVF